MKYNNYELSKMSDMDIIILLEYQELNNLISSLKSASIVKYQDGDENKIKMYQEMRKDLVCSYPHLFNGIVKKINR